MHFKKLSSWHNSQLVHAGVVLLGDIKKRFFFFAEENLYNP